MTGWGERGAPAGCRVGAAQGDGGWGTRPASLPRPRAPACARRRCGPPAKVLGAGAGRRRGAAGRGRPARHWGAVAAPALCINFLLSGLFLPLCSRRPFLRPPVLPARCPHQPAAFVSAKPPCLPACDGAAGDTPGAPGAARAPGSCRRRPGGEGCVTWHGAVRGTRCLLQRGERAEAGTLRS